MKAAFLWGLLKKMLSPRAAAPGPAAGDRRALGPPDLALGVRTGWSSSPLPLHRLLQAELAPRGDDGQAALQVVVDEVADAVEDPVLRADL